MQYFSGARVTREGENPTEGKISFRFLLSTTNRLDRPLSELHKQQSVLSFALQDSALLHVNRVGQEERVTLDCVG